MKVYTGSAWVAAYVSGSIDIDSITDVTITSVADNEVLAYDTTSSKWINQTAAEAGLVATSDIGSTVQAYDATIVVDADIGSTVQAYSSVLQNTTASYTTAEETKLAGIETAADVTDATNVAAAGAVMDGDFSTNGLMKRTGAGTYTIVTDNSTNWDTAYGWGDHSVVDGDFTSNGLMKRTGSGTYSIITDNSSNWNTAYGWGNHASAGYLTSSSTINAATLDRELNVLDGITATTTELNYTDGVTSNIQTQLNAKVPTSRTISGVGLTGTGSLASNRTFTVDYLAATDDRDVKPSDITTSGRKQVRAYFASLGGLTGTANSDYQDLLVLSTYSDGTGGDVNALAFDKSEQKIRHYLADQSATSWGTAKTIAYTDSTMTGTWNGSVIASAYLDSDTAHLSGTQTFSGVKTFSNRVTSSGTEGFTIGNYAGYDRIANASNTFKFITDANGYANMAFATVTTGTWNGTAIADAYISSSSNWNTAYGWGNHASQGYVQSLTDLLITATATELNYVDGVTSNIQTQLNGKLSTSGTAANSQLLDSIDSTGFTRKGSTGLNTASSITTFDCENTLPTATGGQSGLQVYQNDSGADAFMTFHVSGDYAVYFGLDGGTNDLAVGGWSMGANSYKIWHQGNDGSGSTLDADLLDGVQGSSFLRSDAADTFTGKLTGTSTAICLGYDSGSTNSFQCSNWFRSSGSTGWYNGTYGGGIYQIDSTWVRVYASKAFYVANQIAATGDVTAYYSDERLKTKIETIDNAVDKVMSLEGFIYEENELAEELGYTNKGKRQAGVSAQQVEKVLPEAVTLAAVDMETDEFSGEITSKSGENYLTVKYEKLVPLLIQAIKEQQQQINELKEQLNG